MDWSEAAERECIFFSTEVTCAGEELGYDFIAAVKKSKISFTAFCNEKTRQYQTTHQEAHTFMSPNTFISWFFGWLAAHQIDFRKEVDPWCMYNPQMLASDATHIGVAVQKMKLWNKVCDIDQPDILVKVPHRRYTQRLAAEERLTY